MTDAVIGEGNDVAICGPSSEQVNVEETSFFPDSWVVVFPAIVTWISASVDDAEK